MIEYSAIIINYKTEETTANCLRSLLALPGQPEKEIILIDNGSEKNNLENIRNEFGQSIKIISNADNLGYAAANNQGAALASGKYLVFLNSDTLVYENIFKDFQDIFLNNEKVGIISPLLIDKDERLQKISFGKFPSLSRIILRKSFWAKITKTENNLLPVDWVSGACLVIRKDLFERIGGWDDQFFLYYEDIDLCKRASKAGYQTVVALNSQITHLGGNSPLENWTRKKHYYQSQDYYFKKHHSPITSGLLKILRLPMMIIKTWAK